MGFSCGEVPGLCKSRIRGLPHLSPVCACPLMGSLLGACAGSLVHRQALAATRACIQSPASTSYAAECLPRQLNRSVHRRALCARPRGALVVSAGAGNGASGTMGTGMQRAHPFFVTVPLGGSCC